MARRQNGYLLEILNGAEAHPVLLSQSSLSVTKNILEGTRKREVQASHPTPPSARSTEA